MGRRKESEVLSGEYVKTTIPRLIEDADLAKQQGSSDVREEFEGILGDIVRRHLRQTHIIDDAIVNRIGKIEIIN